MRDRQTYRYLIQRDKYPDSLEGDHRVVRGETTCLFVIR